MLKRLNLTLVSVLLLTTLQTVNAQSASPAVVFAAIKMVDSLQGWAVQNKPNGEQHILRTTNGGKRWRDVTPPETPDALLAPLGVPTYFMTADSAWVIYFADTITDVWSTRNAGQSWEKTLINASAGQALFSFISPKQGWLMLLDCCAAGNESARLLHTTDGITWTVISETGDYGTLGDLTSRYHTGMVFDTAQAGWMTTSGVDGNGDLYQTTDGGRQWEVVPLPFPSNRTTFADCVMYQPQQFGPGEILLSVACQPDVIPGQEGYSAYLYLTTNSSATWQSSILVDNQIGESPSGPPQITFMSPIVGWSLKGSMLRKTTDGGQTWEDLGTLPRDLRDDNSFSGDLMTRKFDFINGYIGWAIGASGQLFYTANAGRIWLPLEALLQ